jgi:SdpC family antimicrobial peptide
MVVAGTVSANASEPTAASRPAEASETSYSGRDVIGLLAFGAGPIVDAHPELEAYAPTSDEVSDSTIDEVYELYVKVEPEFDSIVAEPLQSGDPRQAEAALASFADVSLDVADELGIEVPQEVRIEPMAAVLFVVVVAAVAGAVVGTVLGAVNIRYAVNTVEWWGAGTGASVITDQKRAAGFAKALGK